MITINPNEIRLKKIKLGSIQLIEPCYKKVLHRISNNFREQHIDTVNRNFIAVLTSCYQDIYQINDQLESFDSIVESVLVKALGVTLFENCDFHFCEIVVEQEAEYAIWTACEHYVKGEHL